jgi:predicted transcriptional regulator
VANGEKVMNGEKVKRTRMGKKDFAKLGVVVAYIVQHRGHASTKDVEDALLNQCLVTVNSKTVCSVMEALRKKGILAIGHQGGLRVYSMKTTTFNVRVEIAEFTSLYLAIGSDAQAMLIQNVLEGGGKIIKDQKWPSHPAKYRATVKTGILVGQHSLEGSPAHALAYERSELRAEREEDDPNKVFLTFERVGKDRIMINEACIRGWLMRNMPQANMPPSYAKMFGIKPIIFKPTEIMVRQLPIQRPPARGDGQAPGTSIGVGLGDYEAIVEETFVWEFTAPTVNFMDTEEMKAFLATILEYPRERSLSPGRGTQYGGGATLVDLELVCVLPVPKSRQKASEGTGDLTEVLTPESSEEDADTE